MASSLFNAIAGSNGNMMINSMMNGLKRTNPSAFSRLQGIMQSGGEEQAISSLINQLSPEQISQFRSMASMVGINDAEINKYLK